MGHVTCGRRATRDSLSSTMPGKSHTIAAPSATRSLKSQITRVSSLKLKDLWKKVYFPVWVATQDCWTGLCQPSSTRSSPSKQRSSQCQQRSEGELAKPEVYRSICHSFGSPTQGGWSLTPCSTRRKAALSLKNNVGIWTSTMRRRTSSPGRRIPDLQQQRPPEIRTRISSAIVVGI